MEDLKHLEKISKALANRRRLAILKFLKRNGKAPVAEIAEEIGISFKSTSKHLIILSSVDIVEKEQKSLQMFYSINNHQHEIIKTTLRFL